jgi:RNA polymerase sigma-70 factor, ECF subfamily
MDPVQANDDSSEDLLLQQDLLIRKGLLDGDQEIAEAFFQRHGDALFEFVHYRVGGDRGQTEDIVQETMLVALERMGTFEGRSSLHTWLCGIAKNKIRAYRRKRRPVLIEDLLDQTDSKIDRILTTIEREPLPDWVLEKQETQELVGATLSSLPPDYRELLVDKYVDGRSVKEIASRHGKGDKAAESTLHRARLAFSRVFQLLARERGGLGS